jgi:leucine dehydrogenase
VPDELVDDLTIHAVHGEILTQEQERQLPRSPHRSWRSLAASSASPGRNGIMQDDFEHEDVAMFRGARSGLRIIIAIHSTALGVAAGGCRMWTYPHWQAALADVLALSRAMTFKCAAADLDFGGGKAVVVVPPNGSLAGERRRDAMLDFGDAVQSLGGRFQTAEDVGTTAADMWLARRRSEWVHCLPVEHGGSGEPSELTAVGAMAAIAATWQRLHRGESLSGAKAVVIGLGQVGARLASRLTAAGVELTVTDIDPEKRKVADKLGARWTDPVTALSVDTDLLVPAALGGLLTHDTIAELRCAAVVGPANNQLEEESVAEALAARGILWAPDFIVNAGGVIHGAMIDFGGGTEVDAVAAALRVGPRLTRIFDEADACGVVPNTAAKRRVAARVARARADRAAAAPE